MVTTVRLGTFLLKNGRVTGDLPSGRCLVKTKIVHALTTGNYWSCSENSQGNSWNTNFSTGNLNNNNNKYNSNTVRAVAALTDEYVTGWVEALEDCCKHKKMSTECIMYRLLWHQDLLYLAYEVQERSYHPSTSICFVVTRPKLREVFAANFRDRIVQHWLCLRLEPLFEERFVAQRNVSFNCRKGFGTLVCVKQLAKNIRKVSREYTKETWCAQFDVHGFFMSIDCEVLLKYLLPFIRSKWDAWQKKEYKNDLEMALWLTEVIVRHRPQENCTKKGNVRLFDQLPPGKSLHHIKGMKGMPIGNLTSQLFANFYMSVFDEWAIEEARRRGAEYVRFVDDFVFVCPTKEDALYFRKNSAAQLASLLNIKMHPDKVYIQEFRKGVKMVGSVVKPGRTYLGNRTVGGFYNALNKLEELCDLQHEGPTTIEEGLAIERQVKSINSYLGFLRHHQTFAIRIREFRRQKHFWKYCYMKGKYQVVKLRKNVITC